MLLAAQPATFVVQFFCKKLQTYFSYWLRIAVTHQEYLRKGCETLHHGPGIVNRLDINMMVSLLPINVWSTFVHSNTDCA